VLRIVLTGVGGTEGVRWGCGAGLSVLCMKHVELIYENKLHWFHQVGSSRLCSIRCTVTHTC
jgi:hypothetical protein